MRGLGLMAALWLGLLRILLRPIRVLLADGLLKRRLIAAHWLSSMRNITAIESCPARLRDRYHASLKPIPLV
jgi:hypothetical protein